MPGRLTYWKGQEKFIEALNILIEDYNINKFSSNFIGIRSRKKSLFKKTFKFS